MNQTGMVYIVGAGPGDPGLMTVRSLECLRQADVVIYDRLIPKAILDEAPVWADRIYAGKAPGKHYISQDEINDLLVEGGQSGQTVVRLKGGDPCVFGRGSEEAEVCAQHGIPFEIVPGVTSAVAVPECAGIPLTHRGLSGSVAIITAHRADERQKVNWQACAAMDTLVVLMGVAHLPDVITELIKHGRSAETPVAIISCGTWEEEQVIVGALHNIIDIAHEADIQSPATIVVGDVVSIREKLMMPAWTAAAQIV